MRVPFLDLAAQDAEVGAAVRAAVGEVLDGRRYILGPHVERFETAMAAYCGAAHAVGVASGTDALALALMALDLRPGDVVLTTPFSFFATASVVVRLGGRPLYADVDPVTLNLDPAAARDAIARAPGRVVGMVPVHLFGRLAPMPELAALAAAHGLWVVEDAAQAAGARAHGRMAGTFGRVGCLSFYPTKNLGGIGDGGMLITDDGALADRVRRLRHHGQVAPYVHAEVGLCSRLDAVQAAALAAKLPRLDAWNARRRQVAAWYTERFVAAGVAGRRDAPLRLPEPAGDAHVFHQYVIRTPGRDGLARHLAAAGIGTQVYYPLPLHRQPALAPLAAETSCPEAERAAAEVLALPMYPQLDEPQVAAVVDAVVRYLRAL